jgi:probable lipoprotein NlpC
MPDAGPANSALKRLVDRWRIGYLFLILLPLMSTGCATPSASTPQPTHPLHGGNGREQRLRVGIQPWIGTPHRLGGMSRRGIDCSGLVVVVYKNLFGKKLPRTTSTLMHTGRRVARMNLSAGDLVFFQPGTKSRHVGIYLGHSEFVHASTSHGVMISRMDDDFWQACYLTGRRLR